MQVKTDDNGLIVGFSLVGQIEGGQTLQTDLPANFQDKFKPKKFKLSNGAIVENTDFTEPATGLSAAQPSSTQIALTALAQQLADQQQLIKSFEESLTALATSQGGEK